MNVYWTDTARAHLDTIYSYIARDSDHYAKRTVDRLWMPFRCLFSC